jgi:hypothetical protein
MRIHYTADPDKDPLTPEGAEWYAQERAGYASKAKWDREMEICFDTFEGTPVIDNWDRSVFVRPCEYDPKLEIIMGVDYGTQVCGAILFQIHTVPNYNAKQAWLIDEVILQGADTVQLAQMLRRKMEARYRETFETVNFRIWADPKGQSKSETTSDTSKDTSNKIMRNYGLPCSVRKRGIVESTEIVKTIFNTIYPGGQPAILVDPRCEYMIGVFGGGWHYPKEDLGGPHTGKPENDGVWIHGGDMARYALSDIFMPEDFVPPKPQARYKRVPVRNRWTGERKGWKQVPNRRRQLSRGVH